MTEEKATITDESIRDSNELQNSVKKDVKKAPDNHIIAWIKCILKEEETRPDAITKLLKSKDNLLYHIQQSLSMITI